MNEILLLVLAIAGVFSIACSIALISLGTIIDHYPLGDESNRKRSLSSPIESTRITVGIYWLLFVIGGYAVLQDSTYALIIGITTLFSGVLFMFTALILSFAVLHAMRKRKTPMKTPILQVTPVSVADPVAAPVAGITSIPKKYYRKPNFMVDALMKRD
jgi:multisubunit Na+/H+ antiporter MnhC subunit